MAQNIVIIGGGFAGTICAKILETKLGHCNIYLIDDKDYFYYMPALPKLLTKPKYAEKIKISYRKILKDTKIINEKLKVIRKDRIETDRQKLPFKFLIISAGSYTPVILKNSVNYVIKNLDGAVKASSALKDVKNVAVVGGGLTGVEIAAELATKTIKNVTVISGAERLTERLCPRVSKKIKKFLEKKGVNVIVGESIVKQTDNTLITSENKEIHADMAFLCVGIKPNTVDFDKKQFRNVINEKGYIITDRFLRLKGSKNIFVGGDVSSIQEEKTAQNAIKHGKKIAKNIVNMIAGRELSEYYPVTIPMVISLGDWHGIFVWGRLCFNGIIPGMMKHLIEKAILLEYRFRYSHIFSFLNFK